MKIARGFSLIEVMIVVAIIGVLMALGLPSLTEYLQDARTRGIASELRDGLMTARMEAIRRNTTVSITITGASWSIATLNRASPAVNGFTVGYRNALTDSMTTLAPNSALTVTFGGDGRTTAGTGFFDVFPGTDSNICTTRACMRLVVSAGGLVKTCNPSLLIANNPQGC